MRSYDLIACGALNLDLIYRLSPDFPLWKDLGPPGGEQVADERLRRALDDALADVPRRVPAEDRRPTQPAPWRGSGIVRRWSAGSETTSTAPA